MVDFDAIATVYERLSEPLTMPFAEQALSLSGINAGQTIIDVACGTGALAVVAAKMGGRVVAADLAPAMVERARERLRPFPGCSARVMDCQALDAPDAGFDAGFSTFGIMVIPSWREGLAELIRVVRPGGAMGVTVWPTAEGSEPLMMLKDVFNRQFPGRDFWPAGGAVNTWWREGLGATLKEAGWHDVVVHVRTMEWVRHSVQGIAEEYEPLHRFVPGYAALSDVERRQMKEPLEASFRKY